MVYNLRHANTKFFMMSEAIFVLDLLFNQNWGTSAILDHQGLKVFFWGGGVGFYLVKKKY